MWWGLVLAALAAAGKAYQQRQVTKRQDNQMVAGLRQQEEAEQKARAKIQADLQNYSPDKARQTQSAEQGDYLAQVQKAMGGGGPYKADSSLAQSVQLQNQRAQESKGASEGLAKLFGTIGAAGTQRQREAIGTTQTGSALNQIGASANRQFQAKKGLAASIHANPWLAAALNFAEMYGLSSAGAAGAAGGTYATAAGSKGAGRGVGGAGNASYYGGYA